MTYGPSTGTKVTYTYDKLERLKTTKYSDTNTTYGYSYSADGSLAGVTVNGNPAYEYTYDSLGRLIYSAKLQNNRPVLYTSHKYDTSDRLTEQNWQIGSDSFSESYEYNTNDGTLKKMTTGGDTLNYSYNNLKQLSKRTSPKLNMTYSYRTWTDVNDVDKDNNKTEVYQTNQVASVQYLKPGTTVTQLLPTLNYSYDAIGNITQIKEGGTSVAQYSYDDQNQVVQEKIPSVQTSDYIYDTYGNIRSKKTTYGNGSYEQYMYTYGNANSAWKDQLTAISYRDTDGNIHNGEFEYDAVGNPTRYNNGKKNMTFTWRQGRQMSSATVANKMITFGYDVDGIRERKSVITIKSLDDKPEIQTVTHNYTTLGGKIVREAYGDITIDYFYDNNGRPYKIVVKDGAALVCIGYFVVNLQGDVIAIVDSDGAVAVKYQYDAWGREISNTKSGAYGDDLYKYNALKYRGYYYDSDLGLYYLNSRFYDSEIGRFINADSLLVANDLLGYNMYSYCVNNPICYSDYNGNMKEWVLNGVVYNYDGTAADFRRLEHGQSPLAYERDLQQQKTYAATVYAEAGGQNKRTKQAVAHVMNNRVGTSKKASTLMNVICDTSQFNGYNSPMFQQAMNYYSKGVCDNPLDKEAMDECMEVVIPIYNGSEADITGGALFFHSFKNPSDWKYHEDYTQVYVSGTEKFWFYK